MQGRTLGSVQEETRVIDPVRYPALAAYADPLQDPVSAIIGREKEVREVLAGLHRPELSNLLLTAPPGSGKLVPLTTPIPTPEGWTTMGELRVGDEVLGSDGRPTRVSFLSEIDDTPELYDLTFSDGSVVRACVDHQWKVSSALQREMTYPKKLRASQEREHKARRREAAILAAGEGQDLSAGATAEELLELCASVDRLGWGKPLSLHNFLNRAGVSRWEEPRVRERSRQGKADDKMHLMKQVFAIGEALVAMSQSKGRGRASRPHDGKPVESVLTTGQMLDQGVRAGDADARANFAVRVCAPLELPEAELPMDPYALGVWLGDGHVNFAVQANITSMDPEVIERLAERTGHDCQGVVYREDSQALLYRVSGLGADLRRAGLSAGETKRIPKIFLRGSFQQRLELLRGLLDTDGTIDGNGSIELSFSCEQLATDAEELIRSLGIKVRRKVGEAGYRDAEGLYVGCQDRHRMHFTTDLQVFTLPRQAARLPERVRGTQKLLYIESIEPAPSEPGRCIQVDNDDHMYLVGRGLVPTHNTVLVQETMRRDPGRFYLEVDLARLRGRVAEHEMAAEIKKLFDEAQQFSIDEHFELVMFIDEFHQIVQMDATAVEALKPILAASGSRGIRVIAATTYEEWNAHIRPNAPLNERLQRINLTPAGRTMTVQILRSRAEKYGVADQLGSNDALLEQIVDLTDLHVPSSTQPRKSIGVLDGMIGWNKAFGDRLDLALAARVIKQIYNIDVLFSVDAASIQERLDEKVFAQKLATRTLTNRLHIAVAGLGNPTKPKGKFILAGSTGVGKSNMCSTPVAVTDGSTAGARWKTHGELEVGDFVFDRTGRPTQVLGVFPQGMREVYRVSFTDGRSLDVDGEHLWGVYTAKMRSNKHAGKHVAAKVMTTQEIVDAGVVRVYPGDARTHLKFFIPMNGAVAWPEAELEVDPYALGVFLGNGVRSIGRNPRLAISSADEHTVARVADIIGTGYKKTGSYLWVFPTGRPCGAGRDELFRTDALFASIPELIDCYSRDRRIPQQYLTSSIEQRWELVRGLFDTDGTIDPLTGRFNVSYSTFSEGLAMDLRQLLFSLGVSNSLNTWTRTKVDEHGVERELVEYDVHVKVADEDKPQFFSLPRKREIAERAALAKSGRSRVKKFDMVGITSIEKLAEPADSVCILVDNDEHLYQAGEHFVVTHNTELTVQLAKLVFGEDVNRLIRFDMSEFATPETMNTFRSELTKRVTYTGDCVLLFDEIEKADPVVRRLLLQVLDEGRLSDDLGKMTNFLGCYIVMTTNSGQEVFEKIGAYASDDEGGGDNLEDFQLLIRRSMVNSEFPPELLGRVDAIVPFQPLSDETKRKVIRRGLFGLQELVHRKHGVRLEVETRVVDFLLVDKGTDSASGGGARAAMSAIETYVKALVAEYINLNPGHRDLRLCVEGTLRGESDYIRRSKAQLVIKRK